MPLRKMILPHELFNARLLRLRPFLFFISLQLASGCALPWRHHVSHEGFGVLIRSDWVDSSGTSDVVNVWSKWGGISVIVEKLPGKSAFDLNLWKIKPSENGTEEKLTEWFQFKGNGSRFRTYDRNGEIDQETVIFFPRGAFQGFYIKTGLHSAQSSAREQYEQVIKSLKRSE